MIHIIVVEDSTFAVLEGPDCKLSDKLHEWLEQIVGPEPKPRLAEIWDMKVFEREAFWKMKKKWQLALSDFTEVDFIEWLKTNGFHEHEFKVCHMQPLVTKLL